MYKGLLYLPIYRWQFHEIHAVHESLDIYIYVRSSLLFSIINSYNIWCYLFIRHCRCWFYLFIYLFANPYCLLNNYVGEWFVCAPSRLKLVAISFYFSFSMFSHSVRMCNTCIIVSFNVFVFPLLALCIAMER